MILLIGLFIITIICTAIAIMSENENLDIISCLLALITGIVLILCLITIPISRMKIYGKILEYHEFKRTIENARTNNISELERAAILQDISEWNQSIVSAKYYNTTVFDTWIPDEVNDLTPIE